MAVKITLIGENDNGPVFEAVDLTTGEVVVTKNWFEKSKDKWHIVLGPNSANRKYIAHNEFYAKSEDDIYIVEDKTTGPRVLGTAQPDKKLVPYMTAEDKEKYDAIIARAIENRNAQKTVELTEEEKLMAQIAKLEAKLAAKKAEAEATDAE
jgi:copper oxidase (laccase) domain-containing protein